VEVRRSSPLPAALKASEYATNPLAPSHIFAEWATTVKTVDPANSPLAARLHVSSRAGQRLGRLP